MRLSGRILILLIAVQVVPATIARTAELTRYQFSRRAMGVRFEIVLYASKRNTANTAANAALERIVALEKVCSDYDAKSELMTLCARSHPGQPMRASGDLRRVLLRSLEVSRSSQGAFDVTVGPLTKLWRRARRRKQLPAVARLADAQRRVGYRFLSVDEKAGTLTLARQGMRLDLGGIAKGYAVDQALIVLGQHGITRALVDGSGDIALGDPPPGRNGWKVAVASLRDPEAKPTRFLSLANAAVATSGDAYQAVKIGGRRFSHILDPRTGLGLTTASSVTVVARDGATADALASAISVLGPQQGIALAERSRNVEALSVTIENGRQRVVHSRGWKDSATAVRSRPEDRRVR